MGGIDPAVTSPSHVIDHRVGVSGAEVCVKFGPFIGDLITVGIPEIPDIRSAASNDAIAVEDHAGHEFELVGEDLLPIHDAVAIGIG